MKKTANLKKTGNVKNGKFANYNKKTAKKKKRQNKTYRKKNGKTEKVKKRQKCNFPVFFVKVSPKKNGNLTTIGLVHLLILQWGLSNAGLLSVQG